MTQITSTPVARESIGRIPLLAGNLAASVVLAVIAAIATRSPEPVVNVAATFVAIGAAFVVPLTLVVELPMLRRLRARARGASLVEELALLAIGGAALAIPGGLLVAIVTAVQPDYGYGWGFGSSFVVGAIGFALVGVWCALAGRAAYEATQRSRVLAVTVLVVVALAVGWSVLLLLA